MAQIQEGFVVLPEVLDVSDAKITLLSVVEQADGVEQIVTTRLTFPKGTTGVRWNARSE